MEAKFGILSTGVYNVGGGESRKDEMINLVGWSA